jgi:Outer membrane protein beta-barrel domain
MRTILLSFLLLTSYFLFGQSTYKKGYIINNNGDTVKGYIREDEEEKLARSIDFKDQTGVIKMLSVGDIKEFGFEGEGNFRLVSYVDPLDSLKRKTHFAKLLLEGTHKLFSFRRKDVLNFIVVNKDTSYLLYDDVKSEYGDIFEKGNYQSLLSFFSRECPKISSKAANVNFSEESLLSFFVSLEKCKGNTNNTVVYHSTSKAQKNIILSAGGLAVDKRTEIAIQALGQFVLPTVSRKSSLLAGVVFLRSTHESTTTYTLVEDHSKYETQVFEIPVMFRYDILQKVVQPYIYGGAGAAFRKDKETMTRTSLITADTEATGTTETSDFGATVLVGAGINIRIVKDLFINVDYRYDLYSHLPVAGLACKIRLGSNK